MKQGNIYDTFVKEMLGMIFVFVDFLVHYADPKFVSQIDLKNIRPVPTHYVGMDGREQILDLLFQCPLKIGDRNLLVVIIFEHQSKSLKHVPLKLLKYIIAVWNAELKAGKKVLSAPYSIVLRTGKRPHRGPYPKISDMLPKTIDGELIGNLVEIQYDVVDLPAWDFNKIVGEPVLRLAFGILKKMTEGNENEFPEAFKPMLEITNEGQKIELSKKLLLFVDKAMKAHNRQLDKEKVREALKYVFPEHEERSDNMIVSLFEEKYLAGKAAGKTEGKAEGKAEGKIEGKIETIFLFLTDRFGGLSKKLEKKIQKITDLEKLNELLKLAVKCESLNEFEKALN